jgi:hypothetical protein
MIARVWRGLYPEDAQYLLEPSAITHYGIAPAPTT